MDTDSQIAVIIILPASNRRVERAEDIAVGHDAQTVRIAIGDRVEDQGVDIVVDDDPAILCTRHRRVDDARTFLAFKRKSDDRMPFRIDEHVPEFIIISADIKGGHQVGKLFGRDKSEAVDKAVADGNQFDEARAGAGHGRAVAEYLDGRHQRENIGGIARPEVILDRAIDRHQPCTVILRDRRGDGECIPVKARTGLGIANPEQAPNRNTGLNSDLLATELVAAGDAGRKFQASRRRIKSGHAWLGVIRLKTRYYRDVFVHDEAQPVRKRLLACGVPLTGPELQHDSGARRGLRGIDHTGPVVAAVLTGRNRQSF